MFYFLNTEEDTLLHGSVIKQSHFSPQKKKKKNVKQCADKVYDGDNHRNHRVYSSKTGLTQPVASTIP